MAGRRYIPGGDQFQLLRDTPCRAAAHRGNDDAGALRLVCVLGILPEKGARRQATVERRATMHMMMPHDRYERRSRHRGSDAVSARSGRQRIRSMCAKERERP
jgi:hypothetical protein